MVRLPLGDSICHPLLAPVVRSLPAHVPPIAHGGCHHYLSTSMKSTRRDKKGPARIRFDLEKVKAFAALHCTNAEIAAVLEVSAKTVQRRMKDDPEFREMVERGRERGKASLRRAMYTNALAGNAAIQIWLSKQPEERGGLGMREPPRQVEVAGPDGGAVSVTWAEIAKRAAGRAEKP